MPKPNKKAEIQVALLPMKQEAWRIVSTCNPHWLIQFLPRKDQIETAVALEIEAVLPVSEAYRDRSFDKVAAHAIFCC